ncbi:MAG: hypothetical protein HUJ26_05880 [Planctomycetaceae bacterium]|nr:hypothetical protein [Planctomycetaceae bacterium]
MKKKHRFGLAALVAMLALCVVAYLTIRPHSASLTKAESAIVGSWAFISPNHKGKTVIVYHFDDDRHVREEHYHLTSAWPTVPRMTMVGKWSVDKDGRLTVEPDSGLPYMRASMSGWLNEFFDNGRQAWEKPILTRFYTIQLADSDGIQVDFPVSGGGQTSICMLPFSGDPTAVPSP